MRKNQSSALKELEINQLCKLKLQNLRKQLKKIIPDLVRPVRAYCPSRVPTLRIIRNGYNHMVFPAPCYHWARFSGIITLNYIRVHQMQFTTSFQQIAIFASQSDNFFCWQLVTIADTYLYSENTASDYSFVLPFGPLLSTVLRQFTISRSHVIQCYGLLLELGHKVNTLSYSIYQTSQCLYQKQSSTN